MLKRRAEARKILGAASIAFVTYLAPTAWGVTRHVDRSGLYFPQGYKTIQQGIDAASDGDTVLVAGFQSYYENIYFKGKNIVVEAAPGWVPLYPGGDGPGVTFAGTEDETCVLRGFDIQGGVAENGGGICGGDLSTPTHAAILYNLIHGNQAENGGGGIAYCDGVIQGNLILSNTADYGGGLYKCRGSVVGNTILGNSAADGGGLSGCSAAIRNNIIRDNVATWSGGGLYECPATIQGNTIAGNSAGYDGGGLSFSGGTIENNTISGNSAASQGGGLANCGGTIRNNTIAGNSANLDGGGLAWCEGTIINCIIWGNTASAGAQLYNSTSPTYSCIQGWTGGQGNIALDPQFVDPDGPDDDPETHDDNDFRLTENSPCVDAGMNESWMSDSLDLDGYPRIMDGDGDHGEYVDMGAYEYPDTFWYVDASVSESGHGKSWDGAFKTIQEGIDAASEGDTVTVAQGTYVENIQFKGKNIVVTCTEPIRQYKVANTIIDGNAAGPVVTFAGTEDETCVLAGFTIRNGRADYGGGIIGGTSYPNWSHATIQNNFIHGNQANVDGGGLINCAGMIRNNRITGNSAADYGGGLCKCFGAIHNNTITGNSAGVGGGGLDSCSGTIQNCIVWGNTAPDEPQIYPGSIPTYSCIQGWSKGGEGNIALDPHFVDPGVGNYRLLGGSPCIDTGKNESWMTGGVDLEGNPRIVNGTVDMGAYERSPKTWYVDGLVVTPGSGTSWTWAFRTIQEGIDASWHGDTVMVHDYTYTENIHFGGKNIRVMGYDTTERPYPCSINGRDIGPCVTFAGTEDETCELRGFLLFGSEADYGGAICGGDDENHTHAAIVDNSIKSSLARQSGGGIAYCDGLIADNTFYGNHAVYRGGGLYRCDGTIRNNIIVFNSSGNDGGGVSECFATIENNWIEGNKAERNGGGLAGCAYPIQNNVIILNSATRGGGGLYGCRGKVRNNTIKGNTAGSWGGGLDMCDGTILNCIIWGNTASSAPQLHAGSTPTYSCIQDWTEGGEGNIALDPQFVDPPNHDYRLSSGSPCIDAGFDEAWMIGATDRDGNARIATGTVDMGAYEYGSSRLTIVKVKPTSENGLTLTWTSRPAETYDVFVTYRLSGMGWALDSRVPSQGELTTWSSGSMPSSSVFFKVALH